MKQKHPTLPVQIRKVSKNFYKDSRNGQMIHISNLWRYAPSEVKNDPQSEELKHEHWTNKYENY